MQGFELLDSDQNTLTQFLFADRKLAEITREGMFGALKNVVVIAKA